MDELIRELVRDWQRAVDYEDVRAESWQPGHPRVEKCPHGCYLQIYEMPAKWDMISGRDVYRQTRICRKHGFARIYLISGPTALALNWTPKLDVKHPKFEQAQGIIIVGDIDAYKGLDTSVQVDMGVSVKYRRKDVHLQVVEQITDTEFRGAITGFETHAETYEDLALDEEVIFELKHVWAIRK
ncbi:MAG: hypothetical protein AB1512_13810 [Thermodesulfobacteriota bacterium]